MKGKIISVLEMFNGIFFSLFCLIIIGFLDMLMFSILVRQMQFMSEINSFITVVVVFIITYVLNKSIWHTLVKSSFNMIRDGYSDFSSNN